METTLLRHVLDEFSIRVDVYLNFHPFFDIVICFTLFYFPELVSTHYLFFARLWLNTEQKRLA